MIDQNVRTLLETTIDTPIKLQLLLMFHENQQLHLSAPDVAERIYRDIWSTREALRELSESRVLAEAVNSSGAEYMYRPSYEYLEPIRRLVQSYNEPMERDLLQRALRDIAGNAPYRRAMRVGVAFESLNF